MYVCLSHVVKSASEFTYKFIYIYLGNKYNNIKVVIIIANLVLVKIS